MITKAISLLGIASLILFASACGKGGSDSSGEVKWASLTALDLQTEKAFAVAEAATNGAPTQILAEIQQGIDTLSSQPVPKNVKNPDQVKTLLGDLASLSATLDKPGDPALALEYVHDAILTIMEVSGVPHKHDDIDGHGHHDHEHEHEHEHEHSDQEHSDHKH